LLTLLIHPLLSAGIRSLIVASSSGINPQQHLQAITMLNHMSVRNVRE
jgi:hypothetical protein